MLAAVRLTELCEDERECSGGDDASRGGGSCGGHKKQREREIDYNPKKTKKRRKVITKQTDSLLKGAKRAASPQGSGFNYSINPTAPNYFERQRAVRLPFWETLMFLRRAFCSATRRCSQRSQEEVEAYKRKRQAEWKRKQGGNTFLDHLVVTVRGGKGGDGCAAFHREKFKPFGPPSGGNGGRGGDVYFKPTPSLSTLSTVLNRIVGHKEEKAGFNCHNLIQNSGRKHSSYACRIKQESRQFRPGLQGYSRMD